MAGHQVTFGVATRLQIHGYNVILGADCHETRSGGTVYTNPPPDQLVAHLLQA